MATESIVSRLFRLLAGLLLVIATQAALLVSTAPTAQASPALYFPWDHDENPWTLTQGPHNWGSAATQSGLDFDKDRTPRRVLSMFNGKIAFVGLGDPFTCKLPNLAPFTTQNTIVKVNATDGSGWSIWYLHLSKFTVATGTPVHAGDLLGYSGKVGCATAVHLHTELVVNGVHTSWWGKTISGWTVSAQRQQLNSPLDTAPPIFPMKNWTQNGSGVNTSSFTRGQSIRYTTLVRNLRTAAVTATFTFRARGPVPGTPDQIFYWSGSVTVPANSGSPYYGQASYYAPSTIPTWARPGQYYFEMLITYTGADIDNRTSTYAAQTGAFTVT